MQVNVGKNLRPQKVVLYGPEGIGKTTFASKFPNPLFFDIEKGSCLFDVHRYSPTPISWEMLGAALVDFKSDPQGYKTLVIDTADQAERFCMESICAQAGKTGIEDFGYGKGYVYLGERYGKFLNYLNEFIDIGINVVLLAHSSCRKFELPEESGSFDRYELKLEKKTTPLLKEWADMLLFMNYKTTVVETEEKKKKAVGGRRVIYTSHHACWDAKNRHGLPDEIPAEFTQISHCFPSAVADPIDLPKFEPAKSDLNRVEDVKKTDDLAGLIPELAQLMKHNNVTRAELQQVVAQRGYYPADTDISVYSEKFIKGAIIAGWKTVYDMVLQNRKNGGK